MHLNEDLNLEWQTPQGQREALLEQLMDRIDQLENQIVTLRGEFKPVSAAVSDMLYPMADALAIRCLLDVFLATYGYSPEEHGARKAWVTDHKSFISHVTGIAEDDVEDLFQKYRAEGDASAHTFKADSIAYALKRLTNRDDQENLELTFTSILHPLEDELNDTNRYITTLKGGILMPHERRITKELKPV